MYGTEQNQKKKIHRNAKSICCKDKSGKACKPWSLQQAVLLDIWLALSAQRPRKFQPEPQIKLKLHRMSKEKKYLDSQFSGAQIT